MTGLDHSRFCCFFSGINAGGLSKKVSDVYGIGSVIGALVNNLEDIVRADDTGCDLNTSCSPTKRQRHFSAAKWHLVSRDSNRFEDCPSNHALCLIIEIGKIITFQYLGVFHWIIDVIFLIGGGHQFFSAATAGEVDSASIGFSILTASLRALTVTNSD